MSNDIKTFKNKNLGTELSLTIFINILIFKSILYFLSIIISLFKLSFILLIVMIIF